MVIAAWEASLKKINKSTSNLGRRSYWGCCSSPRLQLSVVSGAGTVSYFLTHIHTCVHLQVAESSAYISHPLCYDQFHFFACVQLSVQLLQGRAVSVSQLLPINVKRPWSWPVKRSLLSSVTSWESVGEEQTVAKYSNCSTVQPLY